MYKRLGFAILALAAVFTIVPDAEARSRSRSSYKSVKKVYRPAPRTTVVKKTTIIQNNTSNTSSSSGSSMLGTVAGSMAGAIGGNMIYDAIKGEPEQVAPTEPQVLPEVKQNVICPEGYACNFDTGVILKLPQ